VQENIKKSNMHHTGVASCLLTCRCFLFMRTLEGLRD